MNGDTVIVEFGNNKNCRIPMAKQAISQVEKAGAAATSAEAAPVKKFFGRKKEAAEQTAEKTAAFEGEVTAEADGLRKAAEAKLKDASAFVVERIVGG